MPTIQKYKKLFLDELANGISFSMFCTPSLWCPSWCSVLPRLREHQAFPSHKWICMHKRMNFYFPAFRPRKTLIWSSIFFFRYSSSCLFYLWVILLWPSSTTLWPSLLLSSIISLDLPSLVCFFFCWLRFVEEQVTEY